MSLNIFTSVLLVSNYTREIFLKLAFASIFHVVNLFSIQYDIQYIKYISIKPGLPDIVSTWPLRYYNRPAKNRLFPWDILTANLSSSFEPWLSVQSCFSSRPHSIPITFTWSASSRVRFLLCSHQPRKLFLRLFGQHFVKLQYNVYYLACRRNYCVHCSKRCPTRRRVVHQPWGTNLVQRCQQMGEGDKEGGESGKRSPEDFSGESGNDHSGLKGRSSQSLPLGASDLLEPNKEKAR